MLHYTIHRSEFFAIRPRHVGIQNSTLKIQNFLWLLLHHTIHRSEFFAIRPRHVGIQNSTLKIQNFLWFMFHHPIHRSEFFAIRQHAGNSKFRIQNSKLSCPKSPTSLTLQSKHPNPHPLSSHVLRRVDQTSYPHNMAHRQRKSHQTVLVVHPRSPDHQRTV